MSLGGLVSRIRSGDKSAIRELVSLYGGAIYRRALERLQDKELAREAARQTFGQFVSVVQQQPGDDGWSLWFGDLIERNINAYSQIDNDIGYIEEELERELYEAKPQTVPARTQPRRESSLDEVPARTQPRKDKPGIRRGGASLDEAPARTQPRGDKNNAYAYARFDELASDKRDYTVRSAGRQSVRENVRDARTFDDEPREVRGGGRVFISILFLTLVCLAFLWAAAGIGMSMRFFPSYDLGYSWFNEHLFPLF